MHKPRPDRKSMTAPRLTGEADDSIDRSLVALATSSCCFRCGGLLVPYTAVRNEEEYWGESGPAFRCVNCGEIVDSLILQHRLFGYLAPQTHPRH